LVAQPPPIIGARRQRNNVKDGGIWRSFHTSVKAPTCGERDRTFAPAGPPRRTERRSQPAFTNTTLLFYDYVAVVQLKGRQ
jgi:hypothetical protein